MLLLAGAPVTGFLLASNGPPDLLRLVLFAASVAVCGAHIMVVNTLLGHRTLPADSEAMDFPIRPDDWRPGVLRALAWVSLALALAGFAALSVKAALAWCAIVAIWFLYAHPSVSLKGRPFADTLVHVAAGWLQFVIGALAVPAVLDRRLLLWAVYPTLVLVAGHFHHVIKDAPIDRAAGLRTVGVALGPRACFALGSAVFAASYLHLAWLISAEGWPRPVLALPAIAALGQAAAGLLLGARVAAGDPPAVRRYRSVYRTLSSLLAAAIVWGCLTSWGVL